jgi:hypothetical protein
MLRFKFSVLNGEKVQGSRERGSKFEVKEKAKEERERFRLRKKYS